MGGTNSLRSLAVLLAASFAVGGCGYTRRCGPCGDTAVGGSSGDGGSTPGGSSGSSNGGSSAGAGGQPSFGGAPRTYECSLGALSVPLVRYSKVDLEWTMQEILGLGGEPLPFEWEDRADAGESRRPSAAFVRALWQSASSRAALFEASESQLLPCDAAVEDGSACLEGWLDRYGALFYRRALTTEQRDGYLQQLEANAAAESPLAAAQKALLSMMLSPYFVFRIELGADLPRTLAALPPEPGVAPTTYAEGTRLDGFEVAARLSHFITRSAPDFTLLSAAASGALSQPKEIDQQALRLLASPVARRGRVRQHLEWLGLEQVEQLETLEPELALELKEQAASFIDDVLTTRSGSFKELLSSSRQPLSRTLAEHYGLDLELGEAFELVELEPELHAGVLGQGAWLARNPRPTLRARALFDDLLCSPMPPPPDGVTLDGYVGSTPRERINNATAAEPCRTCHGLFDPAGFALEAFDDQGRLTGFDTTGALHLPSQLQLVELAGPVALGQTIALSDDGRRCAARRYLEHLFQDRIDPIGLERDAIEQLLQCLVVPFPYHDLDLNHLVRQVAMSSVMGRITRPAVKVVAASGASDPIAHAWEETEALRQALGPAERPLLEQYQQALLELQSSLAAAAQD